MSNEYILILTTHSPEETKRLGAEIGRQLERGDVVSLEGDLGVGKTCLIQGIASGLGVSGRVTSPTFTIVHEYVGRLPVYHIDVYRLSGSQDLEAVGYEEYLTMEGVVLIEWADRVVDALPETRLHIRMAPGEEDDERIIMLIPMGEKFLQLVRNIEERSEEESCDCTGH